MLPKMKMTTVTTKMATGKIFPIKNDAACVFKWTWNTFRLYTGTSSSCHRVKPVFVGLKNFDSFHNTPEVIEDRQRMLNNQWPDSGRGCEYCKQMEDAGGISDRTYHNDIPDLTPHDFGDGSLTVTPRIAEVYLNNTCDLACVYCIPQFSSKINEEVKLHGPYPVGEQYVHPLEDQAEYLESYFDWLEKNYYGLKRLHILGGEPLLQKEFWRFMAFMGERDHPELEFHINTNLNSRPESIQKFVLLARHLVSKKKVKRIDISCSLDCWGPQAEFVRKGLRLERWQENFEYLISHKWLHINVHQVVSNLSIGTTLEFQRKIAEWKKINPNITQAYHAVDGPNELIYRPEIFGPEFFRDQLAELLAEYPVTRDWDNVARQRLESIVKLVESSKQDLERLGKLKQTLDQIDQRRHTTWRELFPEINRYFIENGIE